MFVLSSAPFSKAAAIQDASSYIPDDHIMFIHDADLFPPCTLPDALRQTVVRGVQAVNLLLAYENEPMPGGYHIAVENLNRGGGMLPREDEQAPVLAPHCRKSGESRGNGQATLVSDFHCNQGVDEYVSDGASLENNTLCVAEELVVAIVSPRGGLTCTL